MRSQPVSGVSMRSWVRSLKVFSFGVSLLKIMTAALLWSGAFSAAALAQSPLFSVEGELTDEDSTRGDTGIPYDGYPFSGEAGQIIRIRLNSDEFDTVVMLVDLRTGRWAQNDEGGPGSNSELIVRLPDDGEYQIVATAYSPGGRGRYRVVVDAATEQNLQRSERIQSAEQLAAAGLRLLKERQYEEGLANLQAALTIYREVGEREGEASVLGDIAISYDSLGLHEEAVEYQQRSLEIRREIGDSRGEAKSLVNLGVTYTKLRRYLEATDWLEQALSLSRALSYRDTEAVALSNLGDIASAVDAYAKAVDFYQRALRIAVETNNLRGIGLVLSQLGSTARRSGSYKVSIDYHQQALEISRQRADAYAEAEQLASVGDGYLGLSDYRQALDFYQQSLAVSQTVNDLRGEASTLSSLCAVYFKLGNQAKAIDLCEQAVGIARSTSDYRNETKALAHLASAYNVAGEVTTAIDYNQQALSLAQEKGLRALEGLILSNLGDVYRQNKDYEKAVDVLTQSLVIAVEEGSPYGEAITAGNLGIAYYFLGETDQAIEQHQRALGLFRQIEDRQGEAIALSDLGKAYIDAGELEKSEAALTESIAVLDSLRTAELDDRDRITLFETQASVYQILEMLLVARNQLPEALEVTERRRARSLAQLLSEGLSDTTSESASLSPSFSKIQSVAKQQQSTLVEYAIGLSARGGVSLYIWVIQPTGELDFREVSLEQSGEVSALTRLIDQSRESLGDRNRGASLTVIGTGSTDIKESLRSLHQLLIEPIADLLPSDPQQKVVFIPQGELSLVPFAALVDSADRYLIEKHTVLTAPSVQALALSKQKATMNSEITERSSLLAVGNPTMPSVWNSVVGSFQQLAPLPGAEREAKEIAALFNTDALIGREATETVVKQQIENAQIIHLATHGLLEYGTPEDSGEPDVPGAISLAPDGVEDGLLTAGEIFRDLDLAADLVVLSACDTGLGRHTGDGVVGLSRSLLVAGVPSVVVSLWAVPDVPTAELMTTFYEALQQGEDKAQALRTAMLSTLETHPDPRDWAAFTLVGTAQ